MKPVSELKFEQFCNDNSIPLRRVFPSDEKTPDYEITLCGECVIVEVKQLEPNNDELGALRDLRETGRFVCRGGHVGQRVRYKINDSKRQIERLSASKCPGILLLYDARPASIAGLDPYEILVAMYGFEAIALHVPENPNETVRFGAHTFGKGKKLRHNSHTYISAIAVLRSTSNDQLHIDLYHNHFADKPLPLEALVKRKDMTVFVVSLERGNEFKLWSRLVAEDESTKSAE